MQVGDEVMDVVIGTSTLEKDQLILDTVEYIHRQVCSRLLNASCRSKSAHVHALGMHVAIQQICSPDAVMCHASTACGPFLCNPN